MTVLFKNLRRRRIDSFGFVSKFNVICDVNNKVLAYELFYSNDNFSDILDASKFLLVGVH